MNRISWIRLIIIVCVINGVMFGQDVREVSLFSDIKANRVGKGITVLVMEFSEANNNAQTENRKDATHRIGLKNGEGLLGILPSTGIDGEFQNDFQGYARTTRKGVLKAKIAAKIVGINEAGDYLIEGSKTIEINAEKEVYIIRGAVRPEDINEDNTVFSYNIYDAQIVYKGKGEVSRGQKGGFLTRFFQWLF